VAVVIDGETGGAVLQVPFLRVPRLRALPVRTRVEVSLMVLVFVR
jgi:hypothetical protein